MTTKYTPDNATLNKVRTNLLLNVSKELTQMKGESKTKINSCTISDAEMEYSKQNSNVVFLKSEYFFKSNNSNQQGVKSASNQMTSSIISNFHTKKINKDACFSSTSSLSTIESANLAPVISKFKLDREIHPYSFEDVIEILEIKNYHDKKDKDSNLNEKEKKKLKRDLIIYKILI